MSAGLNSSVKRNDVFVSKELVKEHLTPPLNDNSIFICLQWKRGGLIRRKQKFYFSIKVFKYGKAIIQQDIEYFVNNYSLIELFCVIWANYSVLKGINTNESQKKALTIISTATKRRVTKTGMRDF